MSDITVTVTDGEVIAVTVAEPGAVSVGINDGNASVLQTALANAKAAEAEASAAAAWVSELAAAVSAAEALASEGAADASETVALAQAALADADRVAAELAAAAALASELAAAASEAASGVSETNAAASETAAGLSETAAAASETAAGLSETAAAASETAAALSAIAAEAATFVDLVNLDDTTIVTPVEGEVLVFNAVTGKWENEAPAASGWDGTTELVSTKDLIFGTPGVETSADIVMETDAAGHSNTIYYKGYSSQDYKFWMKAYGTSFGLVGQLGANTSQFLERWYSNGQNIKYRNGSPIAEFSTEVSFYTNVNIDDALTVNDDKNGTGLIEMWGSSTTYRSRLEQVGHELRIIGGYPNVDTLAKFINWGGVELYYLDDLKFETVADGVEVSGDITVSNSATFGNTGDEFTIENSANPVNSAVVRWKSTDGFGYNTYMYNSCTTENGEFIVGQNDGFTSYNMIRFAFGGGVKLHHAGVLGLEMVSGGTDITGNLTVDAGVINADAARNPNVSAAGDHFALDMHESMSIQHAELAFASYGLGDTASLRNSIIWPNSNAAAGEIDGTLEPVLANWTGLHASLTGALYHIKAGVASKILTQEDLALGYMFLGDDGADDAYINLSSATSGQDVTIQNVGYQFEFTKDGAGGTRMLGFDDTFMAYGEYSGAVGRTLELRNGLGGWAFTATSAGNCGIYQYSNTGAAEGWGLVCFRDASTNLYFNSVKKLETAEDGCAISGKLVVTGDTDVAQFQVRGHSTQTNNIMQASNSAGGGLLTLDNSGNLDILATFGYISDETTKEHILDEDYGLAEVKQIRPVSYVPKKEWRSDAPGQGMNRRRSGFIAQELRTVIPECVRMSTQKRAGNNGVGIEEDIYTIQPLEMLPAIVNSIKEVDNDRSELQARHDSFEETVAAQALQIAALLDRVTALESG